MSHGDMATPDMIGGIPLPEGVTREDINRVWRAHCVLAGSNPLLMQQRIIPNSRRDLVDYYIEKLLSNPDWMPGTKA